MILQVPVVGNRVMVPIYLLITVGFCYLDLRGERFVIGCVLDTVYYKLTRKDGDDPLAAEQRLILILDEFPYLAEAEPGLPSVVQNV